MHFDYPSVDGQHGGRGRGIGTGGAVRGAAADRAGPAARDSGARARRLGPQASTSRRSTATATVDPDSNYAFGEGGAGTFSDGKLFTRSKKRGDYNKALQTLVFHGATPEILYEAHPHIGTDKLPRIMQRIRQTILGCGRRVRFQQPGDGP